MNYGLRVLLSTPRLTPRGSLRMTLGRYASLPLHRMALSSTILLACLNRRFRPLSYAGSALSLRGRQAVAISEALGDCFAPLAMTPPNPSVRGRDLSLSRISQESNPSVVTGLRAGQSRIAPAGTPALPTESVSLRSQ
jgi:hypothetical protein